MSSWFRTYGFGEILDEFLVGAYPLDADDAAMLEWMGVKRVLNLVEPGEYRPGQHEQVQAAFVAAGIVESRLSFTDYGGLSADGLESAVQEVLQWLDEGRRTYVHCRAGWQRSAAVAAGVVAVRNGLEIDEAMDFVRARKPSADPLPHQRDDLRRWWEARGGRQSGPA
jgi:protein-tyrosine phosphatase